MWCKHLTVAHVQPTVYAVTCNLPFQEEYGKKQGELLGSLLAPGEEEDVPLLYFHGPKEFFRWLASWMIPGLVRGLTASMLPWQLVSCAALAL